ncbi:hypothetical protein FB107DRAFT_263561 [Schizophyllum commune]
MSIASGSSTPVTRLGTPLSRTSTPLARVAELTRGEDLWFPDGQLIVHAGDRIFRVRAEVLEQQSPALRGILAVRQANSHSEHYEGLPVLPLSDQPDQAEHYLRAIFYPETFPPPPQAVTFDALDAVLRLSHKYDSAGLRARGMQHLATLFATDVASLTPDTTCTLADADDTAAFLARALALIRDTRADWALPHALYDLHTVAWADASDLEHIPDGVLAPTDYAHAFRASRAVVDWWPAEDVLLCEERCARRQTCAEMQRGFLSGYMDEWRTDPLRFFWPEGAGEEYVRQLCDSCAATVRSRHAGHSVAFWQAFPAALNLPGWDVLWGMKRRDTDGL